MAAPTEIYALSTQDGAAIPLDIIRPVALTVKAFSSVESNFSLDASYSIAVISVDKACLLRFGASMGTPADGTSTLTAMYIPPNSTITVELLAGPIYISSAVPAENGTAYVQVVQRWAALGLNTQFVRK